MKEMKYHPCAMLTSFTQLQKLDQLIQNDWINERVDVHMTSEQPTMGLSNRVFEDLNMWAAIGLCEEAGEAGGVLKKANYYRKNREDRLKVNPEKFLEEHGDTLHYLMTSLKLNGFTLEDAARANLEKMAIRFKDGWNPEDAINRRDKGEKDE